MFADTRVWVRGAGELGSGVAHLLHRIGFSVFMSEIFPPLAIRRPVTFSDAITDGTTEVEGVTARHFTSEKDLPDPPWQQIPVYRDDPPRLRQLSAAVLVDARMIKHYTEDYRNWADLVIGLGPGFDTETNCHRVIETMRGHDLARVIASGASSGDTGVPGVIGGESSRRIVRSPGTGVINWIVAFGDLVTAGQTLGWLNETTPVPAPLGGIVRGLIAPLTPVETGMKIGDVDPRGDSVQYLHISEKARAIASGVLEAILLHLNQVR
jgi:xanthine dehydrogenase accessory factor